MEGFKKLDVDTVMREGIELERQAASGWEEFPIGYQPIVVVDNSVFRRAFPANTLEELFSLIQPRDGSMIRLFLAPVRITGMMPAAL